jgi:hypothetical protein
MQRSVRLPSLPSLNTNNVSDADLLAYTFTPFKSREQWLTVAKESVNTPRFLLSANGDLVFGSHRQGFKVVDPEYVLYNTNSYSSYELMTLREVLPSLYYRVVDRLPKAKYLVSKQKKEFVRLIDQDPSFEDMVYNYPGWQNTRLEEVERPVKYMKRGYKDITDDVLQSGTVSIIENNNDNDNDSESEAYSENEEISEEEINYNRERQEALFKIQQEIKDRVEARYPLINNVLKSFFSLDSGQRKKFFLYVESQYIFIGASVQFINDPQFTSSITKDNIIYYWRKELLVSPSNPAGGQEMEFFEVLADLTDYVKIYSEKRLDIKQPSPQFQYTTDANPTVQLQPRQVLPRRRYQPPTSQPPVSQQPINQSRYRQSAGAPAVPFVSKRVEQAVPSSASITQQQIQAASTSTQTRQLPQLATVPKPFRRRFNSPN